MSTATAQGLWPPFQRAAKQLVDATERLPWGKRRGGRATLSTIAALIGLGEGWVAHGSLQGALKGGLWGFASTLASEKIKHALDDAGLLTRSAGPLVHVSLKTGPNRSIDMDGHGVAAGAMGALAGAGAAAFRGNTGFKLIADVLRGAVVGFMERFAVTFAAEQVINAATYLPPEGTSTVVGNWSPHGRPARWETPQECIPESVLRRHEELMESLPTKERASLLRANEEARNKTSKWLGRLAPGEELQLSRVMLSTRDGDPQYGRMSEPCEHRVSLKAQPDGEIDASDPAFSFVRFRRDYLGSAKNSMVMWALVRGQLTGLKKGAIRFDGESLYLAKGPFEYAVTGPARTPERIDADRLDQEMSTAITDYLAYVISEIDGYDIDHRKAQKIRDFVEDTLVERHGPETKTAFQTALFAMFRQCSFDPMVNFMIPPHKALTTEHRAAVAALVRSGQWEDAWSRAQSYAQPPDHDGLPFGDE